MAVCAEVNNHREGVGSSTQEKKNSTVSRFYDLEQFPSSHQPNETRKKKSENAARKWTKSKEKEL
jgi:hypothetical protein